MPSVVRAGLSLLCFLASSAAQSGVSTHQAAPGESSRGTDRGSVYEAVVRRAFAAFQPVGLAVAVVEGDRVVLELGLGERVLGGGDPVTPDTLFNIASCSKAFTAAAIARLVDAGKLGWDDQVTTHLPQFRLADPWITREMTVRDLLCHRSGLATFAGDLLWYGSDYDDQEVLRRIESLPITQSFRGRFGYQNLMYHAAGMVLQRVGGRDWSTVMHEDFFAALGMTSTAAGFGRVPKSATLAHPHVEGVREPVTSFGAAKAAGAIWSSVHDLTAWVRMLLAEGKLRDAQFLSREALAECFTPHVTMRRGSSPAALDAFDSYGLGWFLSVVDGKKLVEHDGGMPGYISKVALIPADGFGIVLLNNGMDGFVNLALRQALIAARQAKDGEDGEARAFAIIDRVAAIATRRKAATAEERRARAATRVEGTSPSLSLDRYAGRYLDGSLGEAAVELRDGALHLRVLPSATKLSGTMSHWHRDVFRVDFPDRFLPFALVSFVLDVRGGVESFRIDCPIDDFDFAALHFVRR
ncbi:MAG: serine hydrolase [Planctomycetota bacterium]